MLSRDGVSEKGNLSKQLEKLQDAHQRLSEENEAIKEERDNHRFERIEEINQVLFRVLAKCTTGTAETMVKNAQGLSAWQRMG